MMKKLWILLLVGGCQISAADRAAIDQIGGVVAKYECAKLSIDVSLTMLCVDAAGIAITAAEAKAQGLLGSKRVTKG